MSIFFAAKPYELFETQVLGPYALMPNTAIGDQSKVTGHLVSALRATSSPNTSPAQTWPTLHSYTHT